MFTFATQFLHTDLRPVSTCSHISWLFDKSAIYTIQHESQRHRVQLNEIRYESNTGLTAARHV